MRIPRRLKQIVYPFMEKLYLLTCSTASLGSRKWLIGAEIRYGGFATYVPRHKVSPMDPRTKEQISAGGMTGGDRMLHHGYANKYAQYLRPYIDNKRTVTLVECGVLKGTGLAIWCDLFVRGRIIGLDIDLGHIEENMDNLRAAGAFESNQPELYTFDQFKDNLGYMSSILKGDTIDIFIDDGFHSNNSILNTMDSVVPHLSDEAVYFIEDNRHVHTTIETLYPDLLVDHEDELTIVSKQVVGSA